jgi:hypothetical protein
MSFRGAAEESRLRKLQDEMLRLAQHDIRGFSRIVSSSVGEGRVREFYFSSYSFKASQRGSKPKPGVSGSFTHPCSGAGGSL